MESCECTKEMKSVGYWEYTICSYHVDKIKEMRDGI